MHILLFFFSISFNQFPSHATLLLLLLEYTYESDYTGGPLGLLIIFPEPIFGPPCTASNCDIKRRTIGWTSNANRIHVQRRSECTILSAFCSVKNSRIVEGKILIYTRYISYMTIAQSRCAENEFPKVFKPWNYSSYWVYSMEMICYVFFCTLHWWL